MADSKIRELIRVLFDEFAKTGRDNLSVMQILKTLYLVKMELPDENPLKQRLAYYWYLKGPTSNVIYCEIKDMEKDGMICHPYKDSEMYCLAADTPPDITHDEIMSHTSSLITKHVNSFTSMENMIRDIYDGYSPFPFYTAYNLDFRNKFEEYCRYVLGSKGGDHMHMRNDVLESFDMALLALPARREFFEFRLLCNDYSKSLHVLLMTDLSFDEDMEDDFESARHLCGKIWTAFAYNARLYAYDQHYDQFIQAWKHKCNAVMKNLQDRIKDFSDSVDRLPVPEEKLSDEVEKIMYKIEHDKMSASGTHTIGEYRKIIDKMCR
ncbi:MAG: hypothetical protein D9C04_07625 [Nitrosopumilus sp. B06]|nr:MAG: hypothetical protein D9C04_07625 [Nitrosopumilus sp. B06]